MCTAMRGACYDNRGLKSQGLKDEGLGVVFSLSLLMSPD